MKKLSDYKGEEALDVLADIIEPMAIILADKDVKAMVMNKDEKTPIIKLVKPLIKNHKSEVIAILARVADMPVEEYEKTVNVFTLPVQLMDLINDPQVKSLFQSQSQTAVTSLASFGSATENIEAKGN